MFHTAPSVLIDLQNQDIVTSKTNSIGIRERKTNATRTRLNDNLKESNARHLIEKQRQMKGKNNISNQQAQDKTERVIKKKKRMEKGHNQQIQWMEEGGSILKKWQEDFSKSIIISNIEK